MKTLNCSPDVVNPSSMRRLIHLVMVFCAWMVVGGGQEQNNALLDRIGNYANEEWFGRNNLSGFMFHLIDFIAIM